MTMLHDKAYQAAYARLNPKQKEAVDTIEGPVMVIAGPGTGKTQILTLRIANILRQTQMNPENILALTFTKSGAKAMRERLFSFIGAAAYRVSINTFHGLSERLIREYPEAYTKIMGGQAVTEIEKIEIIETILEAPELRVLRPTGAPQFYVRPILSIISTMKQENVTPDDLARLIQEQLSQLEAIPQYHEKGAHKGKERSEYTKFAANIEKQQALLLVYRQYETLMRERGRYDFDDMIIETVRVLKENESVRLDLQETYQYILADEHQDVNGAQNEILVQLTSYHDNPNLFVVGDEKQAIYRFQGASLENFLHFEKLYPATRVIALVENYRSTQAILDASHNLIKVEDGPLLDYRIPLQANRENTTAVAITAYGDEQHEHAALLDAIKAALAAGTSANDIAVIVRLSGAGIPVAASADADVLEHPLFLGIVDLIEAVINPGDMMRLSRVLMSPYSGVSAGDMARIMSGLSYDKPLIECLRDVSWLESVGVSHAQACLKLVSLLEEIRVQSHVVPPHRLLATLLAESSLFVSAVGSAPIESARVLRRLYDEVEGFVRNGEASTLGDVIRLLRRRMEYRVPLTAPYVHTSEVSVQVMTAHKSKGLEFDTVIIPHVTEASWGKGARAELFKVPLVATASLALEANEDERRLLYVACTRAKRTLLVSYAEQSSDGKVLFPSSFLTATGVTIMPEKTTDVVPVIKLPLPVVSSLDANDIIALIHRTLRERGFSATSLNNCLKNPWQYFYRNVLHVPEVQALQMMYGTALHGVLEYATKQHTATGIMPSFAELRERLQRELGKLPLGTVEYSDLLEKGQNTLVVYREHLVKQLPVATKAELSVRVVLQTKNSQIPHLPLTGKLDRIDLDSEGRAIRVVDYKTGKAKSRNDIEGKTAKADASYRRQLSFYSLLLSLYDDERYRTDTGVLSFIEPDAKGRIHDEEFVSSQAEREVLVQEIESALETLLSGAFLHDAALLEASDYNALGQHLFRQLNP
jgi:DNA helicase II / ATP-dependent DNA helicase PcrA